MLGVHPRERDARAGGGSRLGVKTRRRDADCASRCRRAAGPTALGPVGLGPVGRWAGGPVGRWAGGPGNG
ncbi:hypothetical protein C3V38_12135 [Dietzia sp. oral taxon 368]|nr:hypothetical protein C3V38_12135 [Dietzia sp. oral taxon 368]